MGVYNDLHSRNGRTCMQRHGLGLGLQPKGFTRKKLKHAWNQKCACVHAWNMRVHAWNMKNGCGTCVESAWNTK